MDLNEQIKKMKTMMTVLCEDVIPTPIAEIDLDEFQQTTMPAAFNVEFYRTLRSYNKRIQYCTQTLGKPLGSGSARTVFAIDENKVLKLAKNEKGIAQNSTESEWTHQSWFGDLVAKVYESDGDNNEWIIAERAKKISPSRFKTLTGVDLKKMDPYIQLSYAEWQGKRAIYTSMWAGMLTPEEREYLDDNEFTQEVVRFMQENNMPAGDFGRMSSYGEVDRDGQARVVLIDYGLSTDTLDSLYRRRR